MSQHEKKVFCYVGERIERVDAFDKVTGKALYIDDIKFFNMLYAKGVYSKLPHAKIEKIDTSKVVKRSGTTIVTAKDIPGENEVGVIMDGQPLIAEEKVRFVGDCIALVADETEEEAEKNANLIEISYIPLEGVFNPLDGIKENAPLIHKGGNQFLHLKVRKGDINEGISRSDVILEDTFSVGHQEHLYLETHGVIAVPFPDGSMTIYGSIQCPFYIQKGVSRILGIPFNKINVIQTVTGGGFGGKEDVPTEVCARAALLALKSQRPVKMILSRKEDIVTTSKRHPMIMKYKMGASRDGKLQFAQIEIFADCGAYATLSPVVLYRANIHAAGCYVIPHVKVDTFGIYTNNPPTGAMRGFGQPQVAFPCEVMIEELAKKLGIDPLEFRLKNALKEGDETVTSHKLEESVGLIETIEKAKEKSNWEKKKEELKKTTINYKKRGIGAASIHYGVSLGAAGRHIDKGGAHIQIWQDGSVSVAIGNIDMGQGTFTVISQIAADSLKIPINYIKIIEVDTKLVPDSGPTVASRATVTSGNAVVDAAKQILTNLKEGASILLNTSPQNIIVENGEFIGEGKKVSYKEVVKKCYMENISLSAMGFFSAPKLKWDRDIGQGEAYYVYAYATQIAEVEVDTLTGIIEVLNVTAAHDVGKAINPVGVEGQIHGGVVQGIGYAIYENYVIKDGYPQSTNFSTYIVPTSLDIPKIDTIIVEHPYSKGPFGAKGIGEPALIPTAAAVANAVSDAIGKRIRKLPILPEDILELLNS